MLYLEVPYLQYAVGTKAVKVPRRMAAAATRGFPGGSFPTMITPFHEDGSIHWDMLARLVEWYIRAGSAGLFSPCLSSEFYHLR